MPRPRRASKAGAHFLYDGVGNASEYTSREGQKSCRCASCGVLQYLTPGQTYRTTNPRCKKCGGPLDWTENQRRKENPVKTKQESKVRRCKDCNVKLSKYNRSNICAPCDHKRIFTDAGIKPWS